MHELSYQMAVGYMVPPGLFFSNEGGVYVASAGCKLF